MIAAELAQRRLVQLKQDFAQLLGRGITRGKTLSVNLAQRADEGVAVLVADFAVVVAMAIVETGLAHAALHGARERQHPPAGTKWQSCAATGKIKAGSPAYADQRPQSRSARHHEIVAMLGNQHQRLGGELPWGGFLLGLGQARDVNPKDIRDRILG